MTPRTVVRRPALSLTLAVAAAATALTLFSGCSGSTSRIPPPQVHDGNPARGKALLASYGCISCHTISGVRGADGLVGPPLSNVGERTYIAGVLPNSAANMERWIRDPQGVVPGNAMPNLGVTQRDARDIAAYFFSRG